MKIILIELNWNTQEMEKCIRDLKKLVSSNKNLNKQTKKEILTWIKDYEAKYHFLIQMLQKNREKLKKESSEIVLEAIDLYFYTMYYLLIKVVALYCDKYKLTEREKNWLSNLWKFRDWLLEEMKEQKMQIHIKEIYDLWRKIILILESEEINSLINESMAEKVRFLSVRFLPRTVRTRITKKKVEVSKTKVKKNNNKS